MVCGHLTIVIDYSLHGLRCIIRNFGNVSYLADSICNNQWLSLINQVDNINHGLQTHLDVERPVRTGI